MTTFYESQYSEHRIYCLRSQGHPLVVLVEGYPQEHQVCPLFRNFDPTKARTVGGSPEQTMNCKEKCTTPPPPSPISDVVQMHCRTFYVFNATMVREKPICKTFQKSDQYLQKKNGLARNMARQFRNLIWVYCDPPFPPLHIELAHHRTLPWDSHMKLPR